MLNMEKAQHGERSFLKKIKIYYLIICSALFECKLKVNFLAERLVIEPIAKPLLKITGEKI